MQLIYCGVGSRQTPDIILDEMSHIGEQLGDRWMVRSGFAEGADKAFCFGAERVGGRMEIYLPWRRFNGAPTNDARFIVPEPTQELHDIAARYHPAWHRCSSAAKLLHMRNVCQIRGQGEGLGSRNSDMVICWTPGGQGGGGTGQAIRLADAYGIPVFDLARPRDRDHLVSFVLAKEEEQAKCQVS